MTGLLSSHARKSAPSVYCDWYRRPASVVNNKCALCGSRLHRPLQDPQ